MSLTVLSDEQIRGLLESLSRDEAEGFVAALRDALHEYSTGTQSLEDGVVHQPERTVVHSRTTGATTLFMPSFSTYGHAVKVVTVGSPDADPALPAIKPTGSVTLFSPRGEALGFLHAQTLTAFRTALASSCLLVRRACVRTLTVFGSGLQAYWHVRLALMLRGDTVRQVYIVNRRFSDNARGILQQLYGVPAETRRREGWDQARFSLLTPGYGEYDRLAREHLRASDVVYCCTPSTADLFDAAALTDRDARRKGRLIVAVGSYTPRMRELPRDLLLQAVRPHHPGHHHHHRHAPEGGVVVVDTLDGVLKEAGEIIEAGLQPKQLVELGELVMIHRLAREEEEALAAAQQQSASEAGPSAPTSASSSSSVDEALEKLDLAAPAGHGAEPAAAGTRDGQLARWLAVGNVVYKSVGLGLMDLVVGFEVVRLAARRGVGTRVDGFAGSPPPPAAAVADASAPAALAPTLAPAPEPAS
ncbi:ornithine cyclodeaminase [Durotheca rogersii]|uniref:ornithine cyclodeaminase n=1 Tax=Durotheca rogersii TaxID=419775 RepID=UPI00221E727E|nr:ornithine cyclodeaminase [Durotheca rogersii]KAI5866343.1 ornithine cyclodeaminase [Durotheca rogersii]